jgi:hypothetical protein
MSNSAINYDFKDPNKVNNFSDNSLGTVIKE